MPKQPRKYVVRKVVEDKEGRYKVYLEGKFFKFYLTKDSSIKKYSIVVIRNDRVYKDTK